LDTPVEDFLYRRRRFGSAEAVALHKVLALIGHAVLHGDAAAERGDAIDGLVGDGLRVVEEPVQTLERSILVDLLENVERTRDRLVVGRVQPPRPLVLN